MNLLEVTGIRIGYGKTDAVKGINLRVDKGSIVCLIGANGAGKTTTMKGISGLLRSRTGKILFNGQDITTSAAHRIARLGVRQVPEGRQIFADMTVEENLKLGGLQAPSQTELRKRTEEVLERFPRLRERLTQRAGFLSGGEQQMLAIGRALMSKPRLILLDEPSMGLAPLFVEEIFKIISELRTEGATILLVEQNAQASLEVADYAYVMESGSIILEGPSREVAENPAVVSAYLGGQQI